MPRVDDLMGCLAKVLRAALDQASVAELRPISLQLVPHRGISHERSRREIIPTIAETDPFQAALLRASIPRPLWLVHRHGKMVRI